MSSDELLRGNPIKSSSEDLLDRSNISDSLSRLICNDLQNECCTIGISGQWGCGKTSIINMIKENVKKTHNNIFFIDFCPIDYQTNAEGIARTFFDVLIANLKKIRKMDSQLISKYGANKKKIAENLANTAIETVLDPQDIRSIIKNIKILSETISDPAKNDPIEIVKEKISTILTDSKIKLVIIIDDLDRLMPGESAQILKLIRITANFDNVYYILGYDETTLAKQIDASIGARFLEKFIQVPVHLPEINGILIQNILYTKITEILKKYNYESKDCTRKICESLSLTTMRDMFLLLNRFKFKLGMCPNDICPEDLLALTYIEMKDLDLYNWFFENRFQLCKMKSPFMRENEIKDTNNHDFDLLREYADRKISPSLNKTVVFMYPHIDKDYYELINPDERKDRIRSFYSCSAYFMLNQSSIPINNHQIDLIINDEENGETLYKLMKDLAINNGNVNLLLDKVKERIHELPPLNAGSLAKVLLYNVNDSEFCELLPYGPSKSSSWGGLLETIFSMMGDELIEQFFISQIEYSNPYAIVMIFDYLRELEYRASINEPIPISKSCLIDYLCAIKRQLVLSAPNFEKNNNEERSRGFFANLSLIDGELAKNIFDKVFENDDEIITYLRSNFNSDIIFPEYIEEINSYIPKHRIQKLIEQCDGPIHNLLLQANEYTNDNKDSVKKHKE